LNTNDKTVAGSGYAASNSGTLDNNISRDGAATRGAEKYGDKKLAFYSFKRILD
jgi:hypothetical protein